jgi:hypothetical protein
MVRDQICTDCLLVTGHNGLRAGEIDMAGISTKLEKVTQESSVLSVKARPDLFTFSPASLRVYDEDLNAALRARGHPGMQPERPKAKRTSKRIGAPSFLSPNIRAYVLRTKSLRGRVVTQKMLSNCCFFYC